MKNIFFIIFVGMTVYPAYCTYYEYTDSSFHDGLTLQDGDSLYMNDGGFDSLTLFGNSTATIEGTSPLEEGSGGIWFLTATDASHIDISDGEINQLDLNSNATVMLSGGSIAQIESNQETRIWDADNQLWNVKKHIKIKCVDPEHDTETNLLTGHWLEDGTAFSIQLINVEGCSPVIDNIEFVPEPTGLILLGLSGLLIRRK